MSLDGNSIRVIRAWKGYSQRDLAKMIGVSHSLVSYIESGMRNISSDVEDRIYRALELDNEAISRILAFHRELTAQV